MTASFSCRCLEIIIRADIMHFPLLKRGYLRSRYLAALPAYRSPGTPPFRQWSVTVFHQYCFYSVDILNDPFYERPESPFLVLFTHRESLHVLIDELVYDFEILFPVMLSIALMAPVRIRDVCHRHTQIFLKIRGYAGRNFPQRIHVFRDPDQPG